MIRRTLTGLFLLLLAAAVPALAQSEGDLREYFEGRRVVVLITMPADENGINIKADKGRSIDRNKVGRNLRRYGPSLREGDLARITLVKKKRKHIEFQLNGGGWQGRRRVALRYSPAPKSERHHDIEAELALLHEREAHEHADAEEDGEKKKSRLQIILEEDLEELRYKYDAINAERLAAAKEVQARELEALGRRIRAAGSRFNLRFDRRVPADALTPEGLMAVLEKYVDFSQQSVDAALAAQEEEQEAQQAVAEAPQESDEPEYEPASAGEILKNLRKGLLWKDALPLLGSPSREDNYQEGNFQVKACAFDRSALGIIDAVFVEDVLVRYTISSR